MRVGAAGVDGVMEAWPSLPQAVDGSPKRFSLLRKTWPWIKTGTRLLWAWRWPLAFVCGPVILAAVLMKIVPPSGMASEAFLIRFVMTCLNWFLFVPICFSLSSKSS